MVFVDEFGVVYELESFKYYVYDIEYGECMWIVYFGLMFIKSYFFFGFYYIIMDGISLEVFLDDL